MKGKAVTVASSFLKQKDFFSFNKFAVTKFLEKINWLAEKNDFTKNYLAFSKANANINDFFKVNIRKELVNKNHSFYLLAQAQKNLKNSNSLSKSNEFFVDPKELFYPWFSYKQSQLQCFFGFILWLLLEQAMQAQIFSKEFNLILEQENSSENKLKVNKNNNNSSSMTICYNDFLNKLGLSLKTANRELIDKALDALYDLFFQGSCFLRNVYIKERLVISVVKYKKNKKSFATVCFNTNSFFIMYANPALSVKPCISAFVRKVKNLFNFKFPGFSFKIFYYIFSLINTNPL